VPYTVKNPPDRVKKLPPHAIEIWVSAFNSALDQYKDEEKANKVAWAAVKLKYKKVGDKWIRKATENMKKSKLLLNRIKVESFEFDEEGNIAEELQVLNIGNWKHSEYGNIKISEKDVGQFIKNFDSEVRKDIPITEGHSVGGEEKPAIGWFKQLISKGRDGLWAVIDWTEEGKQLLKSKAYKYFSPEFYTSYEDPETHKTYSNVLVGGALTNFPYFKGLAAVACSEFTFDDGSMNLEEILKKDIADLTDEEKTFLKDHKDELTEEQKETYKDIVEEEEEDPLKEILEKSPEDLTDEDKETLKEKKDDLSDEDTEKFKGVLEEEDDGDDGEEGEEKTEGSEKLIKVSERVIKSLERNAKEGVKAMALLRKKEAENYVKTMTFAETNPRGPLLPKSSEKMVVFLLSLTEGQQVRLKAILGELPKAKLFTELGKESGVAIKASDQVQQLVEAKLEKNDKLEYRQALEQVFAEKPELAEQCEQER